MLALCFDGGVGGSTVEDVEDVVHAFFVEVECLEDEGIDGVILEVGHQ